MNVHEFETELAKRWSLYERERGRIGAGTTGALTRIQDHLAHLAKVIGGASGRTATVEDLEDTIDVAGHVRRTAFILRAEQMQQWTIRINLTTEGAAYGQHTYAPNHIAPLLDALTADAFAHFVPKL